MTMNTSSIVLLDGPTHFRVASTQLAGAPLSRVFSFQRTEASWVRGPVTRSMYLVTFRLDPGEYDAEFHELNDAIQAAAEATDGYLGKRTWRAAESEEVLVVYYWETLEALESFGADPDHETAKRRWTEWYDAYEVVVTEVVEAYGSGFGDDADPPV